MKHKILVSDALSKEGIDLLDGHPDFDVSVETNLKPQELLNRIPNFNALLIRSQTQVTSEVIKKGSSLKMIGRAGIGVDNIDLQSATTAKIVVMNTPHGNTVTTAEHAICLLMSLARNIPQATANIKSGKWQKSLFKGVEIRGKTLGVIGLGNIGKEVAKLGNGLQMKVCAFDPFATKEVAAEANAKLVLLDELFQTADFVTVHVPLNQKTHHLLNKSAFEKMKKGVFVINAARGGIIDETALLFALEKGIVRGAALDVFETEPPVLPNKLIDHPNLIATTHLGASTTEAQERVGLQLAEQTIRFFVENKIINQVNK